MRSKEEKGEKEEEDEEEGWREQEEASDEKKQLEITRRGRNEKKKKKKEEDEKKGARRLRGPGCTQAAGQASSRRHTSDILPRLSHTWRAHTSQRDFACERSREISGLELRVPGLELRVPPNKACRVASTP